MNEKTTENVKNKPSIFKIGGDEVLMCINSHMVTGTNYLRSNFEVVKSEDDQEVSIWDEEKTVKSIDELEKARSLYTDCKQLLKSKSMKEKGVKHIGKLAFFIPNVYSIPISELDNVVNELNNLKGKVKEHNQTVQHCPIRFTWGFISLEGSSILDGVKDGFINFIDELSCVIEKRDVKGIREVLTEYRGASNVLDSKNMQMFDENILGKSSDLRKKLRNITKLEKKAKELGLNKSKEAESINFFNESNFIQDFKTMIETESITIDDLNVDNEVNLDKLSTDNSNNDSEYPDIPQFSQ